MILPHAATDDHVRLAVEESGPGLDTPALPDAFEQSYRADSSSLRDAGAGGSGLGLAIDRSIVLAYGGRSRAEVRPAVGLSSLSK